MHRSARRAWAMAGSGVTRVAVLSVTLALMISGTAQAGQATQESALASSEGDHARLAALVVAAGLLGVIYRVVRVVNQRRGRGVT